MEKRLFYYCKYFSMDNITVNDFEINKEIYYQAMYTIEKKNYRTTPSKLPKKMA